jgi:hypothetical protein
VFFTVNWGGIGEFRGAAHAVIFENKNGGQLALPAVCLFGSPDRLIS